MNPDWNIIIEFLKKQFPKDKEIWINHIHYINLKENSFYIKVPNSIYINHFKKNYLKLLQDFLEKKYKNKYNFVLTDSFSSKDPILDKSDQQNEKKSLAKNFENKKKFDVKKIPFEEKNTFSQFVVGPNNHLAYAASQRIAENPGKDYNPFFIYGGVGLGKTHLIQSIGNEIKKNSSLIVFYITTEQFTNEYIQSLRKNQVEQFRLKYRYADILLMDDIQFLENKEKIQEEIFHTFNELKQTNSTKQMVFTSDRSPRELKTITDRLLSRFTSGLVVDIKPPNLETRKSILKKKIIKYKISLNEEILDFLAYYITDNIRDLEAAIIKLKSIEELLGEKLSLKRVEEELHEILKEHMNLTSVPIQVVIDNVAEYYSLSLEDLKSKKRTINFIRPRQVAIYLIKTLSHFSSKEIGLALGGRKHATISIAYNKVKDLLKTSLSIQNDIEQIKSNIRKILKQNLH